MHMLYNYSVYICIYIFYDSNISHFDSFICGDDYKLQLYFVVSYIYICYITLAQLNSNFPRQTPASKLNNQPVLSLESLGLREQANLLGQGHAVHGGASEGFVQPEVLLVVGGFFVAVFFCSDFLSDFV